MSIKPTIFKNTQAGGSSGARKSIKGVSNGDSNSISKLSDEAKNIFGFSRSSAYDAQILEGLKGSQFQYVRSFASTGSSTDNWQAAATNLGTVDVAGKFVNAPIAANALPGSARPDIFDDGCFGPGQKNFREIWGKNGLGDGGGSEGGSGAYGDFIANVVKPKMHEPPADAVVQGRDWEKATTSLGFLFKDGNQLNTALEHALGKLEGDYKELGKDMWSTSFLTANGISKEAANGGVGDFLLSDKKYFDGVSFDQVGISGNALEQFTHDANKARMAELLSGGKEDLSLSEVTSILEDKAGITGDKQFFAGSARGFIETAKNFEFLDNFDSKISEAMSKDPALAGEKAKFNINISFLPYSGADSGAFPAINRGHEFGQQSKLKDFGLSFDPEKPNQLNYMINSEAQLEKLLTQIQDKFANNENAEIGKLGFDFHRHGGEDGSNLTGNAQGKDNGNNEGGSFAVNDENNFDCKTDGDIYQKLGEIAGENGADVNINGDSCHSGNHTDLIKDDLVAGIKKGQEGSGRDEMLKLSIVDNGEQAGFTPAQSLKSHQGYMTYKFDNDGAAGLEFTMSNSSLGKTRRDDLYVNKDTDENKLDAARADKSQQGQTSMNKYVAQAEKSIDNLMARKEAGSADTVVTKDDKSKSTDSSLASNNSESSNSNSLTNTRDALAQSTGSGENNSSGSIFNELQVAQSDSRTDNSSNPEKSIMDELQVATKEPEQKKPEENTATN